MAGPFWIAAATGPCSSSISPFPRDVDPEMNKVEGCFVYDIDDLQQTASANLADRSREAAAAETIVAGEVERYQKRLLTLDAVPAIKALQQSAETIRQNEVLRAQTKLAGLSPEQREAVEGANAGTDGEAPASAADGSPASHSAPANDPTSRTPNSKPQPSCAQAYPKL